MKQKIKIPGYEGEWVEAHCTETLTAEDEVLHFVKVKKTPMPNILPGDAIHPADRDGHYDTGIAISRDNSGVLVGYGVGFRRFIFYNDVREIWREGNLIWERPFSHP